MVQGAAPLAPWSLPTGRGAAPVVPAHVQPRCWHWRGAWEQFQQANDSASRE